MTDIPLQEIEVGERLRAVDPDYVAMLAESIEAIGLQQPIVVARTRRTVGLPYRLVSGAHRLEAARLLGWPAIDARVCDQNAMQRELAEIDENLCRRDLSVIDRGRFLARRMDVWREIYPQNHGGERRKYLKNRQVEIFSVWRAMSVVAEKMGVTPRYARCLFRVDELLVPDVRERLGQTAWASRYSDLCRLSRMPAELQRRVCDLLLAEPRPKSVAAALLRLRGLPQPTRSEIILRRMRRLWDRADERTRASFLGWLAEIDALADLQDLYPPQKPARQPRLTLVGGNDGQT